MRGARCDRDISRRRTPFGQAAALCSLNRDQIVADAPPIARRSSFSLRALKRRCLTPEITSCAAALHPTLARYSDACCSRRSFCGLLLRIPLICCFPPPPPQTPVITAFEAELAFRPGAAWDPSRYRVGFPAEAADAADGCAPAPAPARLGIPREEGPVCRGMESSQRHADSTDRTGRWAGRHHTGSLAQPPLEATRTVRKATSHW